MNIRFALSALAFSAAITAAGVAQAGAIRNASEFNDSFVTRNDDGSSGLVDMGFSVNFFGLNASKLYVNNNGNVTFDGALSTFTPFPLANTTRKILAPFFGDVDTRNASGGLTQYGTSTIGGRGAFGVNWIGVGYFASHVDKLNSFQLIITERSDIAAGDFDFEFNYDTINWETGDASSGNGGLGGSSARVGWSNGNANTLELAGSAVNGAFLDGGPNALIAGSLNSDISGRYIFNVRNGAVQPPLGVPEPSSLWLTSLALLAVGVARRKAKSA